MQPFISSLGCPLPLPLAGPNTGCACPAPQLTRLAVVACSLRELPAGPYLRSLRELVLFANNLQ